MKLVDFSNAVEIAPEYTGSEKKKTMILDNKKYLVKFPDPNRSTKLEISYINSVAYQAGELKHGTISLIEASTPVIAIATNKNLVDKTISNIKETKARGAYVIYESFIDPEDKFYDEFIKIPEVHPILESILTIIPLQLLAYKVAKNNNCDIDKPRNLAKSVTVE